MLTEVQRSTQAAFIATNWQSLLSWGLALILVALASHIGRPAIKNELYYRGADYTYFAGAAYLADKGEAEDIYLRPVPPEVFAEVVSHGYRFPGGFAYTPITAYAAVPLLEAPILRAVNIWQAASLVATGIAAVCVASAFKSWHWRIAVIAAAFAWQPFLLSVRFAQTGVFAAMFAALGYAVFFRYKPAGAVLLGLLVFKPPLLIGPALAMLGERPRVFIAFGASVIALGIVPLVLIGGFDVVLAWVDIILERFDQEVGFGGHKLSAGLSRTFDFDSPLGLAALGVFGALCVGAILLVSKRLGSAEAAIVGILAATIASPHSLLYDWAIVYVTILLARKAAGVPYLSTDLGAGIFALSLFAFGQWSWHLIDTKGQLFLHPLTLWSLLVCAGLVMLAYRRGGMPLPPDKIRRLFTRKDAARQPRPAPAA